MPEKSPPETSEKNIFKEIFLLFKKNTEACILWSLVFTIFLILLNLGSRPYLFPQHYVAFTQTVLEGRLDIDPSLPITNDADLAEFNGQYHLVWGFLPALFFLPFVTIWGKVFSQGYLQPFFGLWIFVIIYKLTKKLGFKKKDALWLTLVYIAASSFLGVFLIPASPFINQLIANIFIFYSLSEFFGKRNWLIIGIFVGLAILSRPTTFLSLIFFISYWGWNNRRQLKRKVGELGKLLIGVLAAIFIYAAYNYLRFSSFFESGYSYQRIVTINTDSPFLLSYLPENFYNMFLKPPQILWENIAVLKLPFLRAPVSGFSWLLSSFSFLLVFKKGAFWKKDLLPFLTITLISGTFLCLIWFSHGGFQFGYRLFLDFQPFLYIVLLLKIHPQLNREGKILILVNIILNIFLLTSIFTN